MVVIYRNEPDGRIGQASTNKAGLISRLSDSYAAVAAISSASLGAQLVPGFSSITVACAGMTPATVYELGQLPPERSAFAELEQATNGRRRQSCTPSHTESPQSRREEADTQALADGREGRRSLRPTLLRDQPVSLNVPQLTAYGRGDRDVNDDRTLRAAGAGPIVRKSGSPDALHAAPHTAGFGGQLQLL
jgi:hypothetical protein